MPVDRGPSHIPTDGQFIRECDRLWRVVGLQHDKPRPRQIESGSRHLVVCCTTKIRKVALTELVDVRRLFDIAQRVQAEIDGALHSR